MAANFIGPVVDWVIATLQAATPGLLSAAGVEPFGEFRKSWTGVAINWPPVAVMPRASDFDPETTSVHTMHGLTIKFGVSSDDPDAIEVAATVYMKAIDDAITQATGTWLAQMSHVHISRHDYGPLFGKDGGFAKFPEMILEVETYEV